MWSTSAATSGASADAACSSLPNVAHQTTQHQPGESYLHLLVFFV